MSGECNLCGGDHTEGSCPYANEEECAQWRADKQTKECGRELGEALATLTDVVNLELRGLGLAEIEKCDIGLIKQAVRRIAAVAKK
jgi:hypothetical protein